MVNSGMFISVACLSIVASVAAFGFLITQLIFMCFGCSGKKKQANEKAENDINECGEASSVRLNKIDGEKVNDGNFGVDSDKVGINGDCRLKIDGDKVDCDKQAKNDCVMKRENVITIDTPCDCENATGKCGERSDGGNDGIRDDGSKIDSKKSGDERGVNNNGVDYCFGKNDGGDNDGKIHSKRSGDDGAVDDGRDDGNKIDHKISGTNVSDHGGRDDVGKIVSRSNVDDGFVCGNNTSVDDGAVNGAENYMKSNDSDNDNGGYGCLDVVDMNPSIDGKHGTGIDDGTETTKKNDAISNMHECCSLKYKKIATEGSDHSSSVKFYLEMQTVREKTISNTNDNEYLTNSTRDSLPKNYVLIQDNFIEDESSFAQKFSANEPKTTKDIAIQVFEECISEKNSPITFYGVANSTRNSSTISCCCSREYEDGRELSSSDSLDSGENNICVRTSTEFSDAKREKYALEHSIDMDCVENNSGNEKGKKFERDTAANSSIIGRFLSRIVNVIECCISALNGST